MNILIGDCRAILPTLPENHFRCCVASPPYWGLRDYGHADQIGQEKTIDGYVRSIVGVMSEVKRVLTQDGTLWLNLGDSYAGSWGNYSGKKRSKNAHRFEDQSLRPATSGAIGIPPKNLCFIPHRVALALQDDGWIIRQTIIWHKPNAMPESVTDRPTSAHEYVFLCAKSERYYYDSTSGKETATTRENRAHSVVRNRVLAYKSKANEMRGEAEPVGGLPLEPPAMTRNLRSVWTIQTTPTSFKHFAVMPELLAERCIAIGSAVGDHVLDPFGGSGTTGKVAQRLGRIPTMIELNQKYESLITDRTAQTAIRLETPHA